MPCAWWPSPSHLCQTWVEITPELTPAAAPLFKFGLFLVTPAPWSEDSSVPFWGKKTRKWENTRRQRWPPWAWLGKTSFGTEAAPRRIRLKVGRGGTPVLPVPETDAPGGTGPGTVCEACRAGTRPPRTPLRSVPKTAIDKGRLFLETLSH